MRSSRELAALNRYAPELARPWIKPRPGSSWRIQDSFLDKSIGLYLFNEPGSRYVYDLSKYKKHLYLENSSQTDLWQQSITGPVLHFRHSSEDRLYVYNAPSVEWNEQHTIFARIYAISNPINGYILVKQELTKPKRGPSFFITINKQLAYMLRHTDSPSTRIYAYTVPSYPVPTNQWFTCAATYDGSGFASGIEFYLNGKWIPKEIVEDNLNQNTTVSGARLWVGGLRYVNNLNGKVDVVSHWKRLLSAIEIRQLHENFYHAFKSIPEFFNRSSGVFIPTTNIRLGSIQPNRLYRGSTEIQRAYYGSTMIWDV